MRVAITQTGDIELTLQCTITVKGGEGNYVWTTTNEFLDPDERVPNMDSPGAVFLSAKGVTITC